MGWFIQLLILRDPARALEAEAKSIAAVASPFIVVVSKAGLNWARKERVKGD